MADEKINLPDQMSDIGLDGEVLSPSGTDVSVEKLRPAEPDARTVRQSFEFLIEKQKEKAIANAASTATEAQVKSKISKATASYRDALKKLGELNVPLDDLIDDTLNSKKQIESLMYAMNEKGYTVGKKAAVGSAVRAAIMIGRAEGRGNAVSDYENMHRGTPKGFNFQKSLGKEGKKLVYPEIKEFSKAVEKGISSIPDPEARAYAALRLLTGIRDDNLDELEIGWETPKKTDVTYRLDSRSKTVIIFNKGNVQNYKLGDSAFNILESLREDAIKEENEKAKKEKGYKKRNKLFSRKVSTLKTKTVPAIREAFKEAGIEITEKGTTAKVDFTMGNLRRNFFSILNRQYGPEVANELLGHSQKGDVGLKHYEVEFVGEESPKAKAAEGFFKIFGDNVGKTGPKSILTGFGLKSAAKKSSKTFEGVAVSEKQADVEVSQEESKRKTVDIGQSQDEQIESLKSSIEKQKKIGDLQQQLADMQADQDASTKTPTGPTEEELEERRKLEASKKARLDSIPEELRITAGDTLEEKREKTSKLRELINSGKVVLNNPVVKGGLKFVPYVGGALGAQAVLGTKEAEAKAAEARGEKPNPLLSKIRDAQMIEEVFSPLPVTTHDVEEGVKYIAEETPKMLEKQRQQALDVSPAAGFARQQAKFDLGEMNPNTGFLNEYEGFIPTPR